MKKLRIAAAATVVAAAALLLSACGGTSENIGGDVIAPITTSAGDLQGTTVELQVGQVLNITTGDLAVDSYSGTVADTKVAKFTAGKNDGSAEFNPGVEGIAPGETEVTLSNSDGGIQDVEFTVVVVKK